VNPKKDKGNYLAWKSWDSFRRPKDEGGLDFRKSKAFNQALLAKIAWWVASDRDSICVRALRSKYKVDEDWLGSEPRKNASHLWRAIEKLRPIIKMGACFLVGDGLSIDMWKDPWVPWLEEFTPKPLHANDPNTPMRVSNLFNASNRSWKTNIFQQLVDQHSLEAILEIPIPMHAPQDKLIWTLSPSGCFSVKSAISSCLAPGNPLTHLNSIWHQLWKLKLHERFKVFMWRLGSNSIPTKLVLAQRIGSGDTMRPLCNLEEESYSHIFLKCQAVRLIWFGLNWGIHPDSFTASSGLEFLELVINPPICIDLRITPKSLRAQTSIQLALTLESIWLLRNQVVHNDGKLNHLVIVKNLEARLLEH
jgi:hypothetical protein